MSKVQKIKLLFSCYMYRHTHTHTRTGTRVGTGLEEEPECGGLKYLGKEIRLDPAVIGSHGRF